MIRKLIKQWLGHTPQFRQESGEAWNIDAQKVTQGARAVVDVLQRRGFNAFIVGGAVRDMLLGKAPKDFDVATDARPEEVKPLFRRAYIIGRRFRIVHVHWGSELIEVTTFRGAHSDKDDVNEHGRILSDNAFGTQLEDAMRRDFTINALYYDPHDNSLWDAHHGLADLRKKHLRLIGKPAVRFREDPVRILRILRFSAKLHFTMDRATQKAIQQLNHLLEMVPSARLTDEFAKFLLGGYAVSGLTTLSEYGLLHLFLHTEQGESPLSPLMRKALSSADQRFAEGKKCSLAFLLAVLLWECVQKINEQCRAKGLHPSIAMQDAMNEAIALQLQKVSMTKAVSADIRALWVLQHALLFPRPRHIHRLAQNRALSAAIDFLELRAAVDTSAPINPSHYPSLPTMQVSPADCAFWAHWWRSFMACDADQQNERIANWEQTLQNQLRAQKTTSPAPKKPRRRSLGHRRAPSAKTLPSNNAND